MAVSEYVPLSLPPPKSQPVAQPPQRRFGLTRVGHGRNRPVARRETAETFFSNRSAKFCQLPSNLGLTVETRIPEDVLLGTVAR